MATYRKADGEVSAIIAELMQDYHSDLVEAGVRVGARFAFAAVDCKTGEPKGPALKKFGVACAAQVRVVSQKDRVAGLPDCIIDIDGEAWEKDWSADRQRAVLDHELEHIEIARDQDGAVKLDDCNRPKLKLKPDDYCINGFEVIAKRWGDSASEVESARRVADEYGQLLFGFMAKAS